MRAWWRRRRRARGKKGWEGQGEGRGLRCWVNKKQVSVLLSLRTGYVFSTRYSLPSSSARYRPLIRPTFVNNVLFLSRARARLSHLGDTNFSLGVEGGIESDKLRLPSPSLSSPSKCVTRSVCARAHTQKHTHENETRYAITPALGRRSCGYARRRGHSELDAAHDAFGVTYART